MEFPLDGIEKHAGVWRRQQVEKSNLFSGMFITICLLAIWGNENPTKKIDIIHNLKQRELVMDGKKYSFRNSQPGDSEAAQNLARAGSCYPV